MANKAVLTIEVLVDAAKASAGLDKTSGKAGRFGAGVRKAAMPAAAALVALGAAGLSAANAAAEDAASQAILAKALKNSTGATDAGVAQTEEWISQTSKAAAVSDDVLRPALGTLARATGDVQTSQEALTVALDISAATGKDVGSVSAALAKGYAGNTSALGRLVPGIDKAVLATGDMDKVMAELARTTGGSAAAAADSAAGRVKGMRIQLDEAQESLGAALLPALATGANLLADFAGWAQQNTTLLTVIAVTVGAVAGAIVILNAALKVFIATQKAIAVATKIWAATQWALNAAMAANPIGLVIVAVAVLIAGIVLLWKKNETFRRAVIGSWKAIAAAASAAWRAIRAAAAAVWNWLRSTASSVGAFIRGVWSGIRAAAAAAWNGIKAVVQGVLSAIRAYLSAYKSAVLNVWSLISKGAGAAWKAIRSAASAALNAILSPINAVKNAIDAVIDAVHSLIDWLGRIKIPKIKLPKIPGVTRSAAVPAAGGAAGGRAMPTQFGGRRIGGLTAAGATVININVSGTLNDADSARALRRVLRDDSRQRRGIRIGQGALT